MRVLIVERSQETTSAISRRVLRNDVTTGLPLKYVSHMLPEA